MDNLYRRESKRSKMVLSGVRFERTVASYISVPGSVLLNREFMSPRLHKGIECDLIVITSKKIYCVECKNYNGFIAGDMFSYTWKFASSGKLGRVQNPYLLNRKRIRVIRGAFYKSNITPPVIESVIVVPDKCKIHTDIECNVVNLSTFVDMLSFNEETLNSIYNVSNIERYLKGISIVREIKG